MKNALRKSAKGQNCLIRIPGICNFDPEKTVLCHMNGGGAGMKSPDLFAAFGCSDCHDTVDHRRKTDLDSNQIQIWFFEGIMRTQQYWLDNGYIEIK